MIQGVSCHYFGCGFSLRWCKCRSRERFTRKSSIQISAQFKW